MNYIVATTEGQPKNAKGGRDFKKLGTVSADTISDAKKKAAAQFGPKATVMVPSEWAFLSKPAA